MPRLGPRLLRLTVLVIALVAGATVSLRAGADPPPDAGPAFVADELLVGFHAGLSESDEEAVYAKHAAVKLEKLRNLPVHRIRLPAGALEAIEQKLKRDPAVKFVERNLVLPPDLASNDPYFSSQYHLSRIFAPQAWDETVGGPEVVIAVLDTGIDAAHPDLAGKLVAGYNFYSNNTNTADVHGHGTKVAGAAAATGNNGVGVTGVSWQGRIMPIRVTDASGYAYYSTIANGLTWAVDHGAQVMNISIGGVAASSSITSAAQYVTQRGGVVVAGAGNCGCVDGTPDNAYILSVSATDSADNLASWSSRGNYVDLAAPGASIWTTVAGGGYGAVSGTSFSSPVTAGMVALVMSANPDLNPAEIETLLQLNADDLGTAGWDQSYGHGRINAYRTVAAAVASIPPPDTTAPSATITSPSGGSSVSGTVTVAVSASDNTGVSRVDLYVDGALYGTDTTAPHGFAWDTTVTGTGTRRLTAKAYDATGNAGTSADVTVSVTSPSEPDPAPAPTADATAPVVSITSLSAKWPKLTVAASATDNVGVTQVELHVDGKWVATDTGAPYSFNVNLNKLATGSHTAVVKAFDAAGNSATS
ncbi:MAG TPA: S8 family serine peptidase, partial [Methylomirabilota bacterium]|nr:S8 family serine peptidase [Methylomirabilota bacterium]